MVFAMPLKILLAVLNIINYNELFDYEQDRSTAHYVINQVEISFLVVVQIYS